jgi:hypothetical protein
MRERSSFACGLALTAALVSMSPYALAATPQHKKPARPIAAKSTKVQLDEEPAPKADDEPAKPDVEPPVKADDEPAAKPSGETLPKQDEKPAAKTDAQTPTLPPVEDAEPHHDQAAEPAHGDEAELGRREAARIKSGRIEVAVWVGSGVANRRFTYSDAVGYNLAPYRLPAAPMASFGIEAYPAASTGVPVLRDLGIRAHVSRGFAFDSNTPQNVTLETSWTRFGGELRERLLLPGPHAFELGVLVGVDASYFGMSAKAPVPALLPAARTVAVRFGVDSRLLLAWRLSVLAGGAYLLTTSRGEIYDHFRHPHVAGVDADFGFAINLGSGFEARLTGRYTRYFASFKPVLGDVYVAGGALDEQLQAGLGVRYAH